MRKTNIGITADHRQEVAIMLSKLLADEFVLYSKILNAHWNIEGPDFHAAHSFLETLYNQQQEIVDTVAERIRTLGHYVPAQLQKYLELTHLAERQLKNNSSLAYYADLLEDYESIIQFIRQHIESVADDDNAADISDFITGLMEQHDKTAWMLRSHLK